MHVCQKFAKGHFHINPIQKKFENIIYLIIDSSEFKSIFSIQLQIE